MSLPSLFAILCTSQFEEKTRLIRDCAHEGLLKWDPRYIEGEEGIYGSMSMKSDRKL
jgi:hypothetical protein